MMSRFYDPKTKQDLVRLTKIFPGGNCCVEERNVDGCWQT